jgi:cell division GTPase FtsZ
MLSPEGEGRPSVIIAGVGGAGCNAISISTLERFGILLEDQHGPGGMEVVKIDNGELQVFKTTSPHLLTNDLPIVRHLEERLRIHDIVFIFSGLGGETGSHVAPVLASIARRHSGLVVSVVCTPFTVEGNDRKDTAAEGLRRLALLSDMCVVLTNDGLVQVAPQMQFRRAFKVMDQIMGFVPTELGHSLTKAGMRQLREQFRGCRESRLGVGFGQGMFAEKQAVRDAFTSPWFDVGPNSISTCLALFAMPRPEDHLVHDMLEELKGRIPSGKIIYAVRTASELDDRVQATIILGLK